MCVLVLYFSQKHEFQPFLVVMLLQERVQHWGFFEAPLSKKPCQAVSCSRDFFLPLPPLFQFYPSWYMHWK